MNNGLADSDGEAAHPMASNPAQTNLAISWEDSRARHRDILHVGNFRTDSVAVSIPGDLAQRMRSLNTGEAFSTHAEAGQITGTWSVSRLVEYPPAAFDHQPVRGLGVQPRVGRFYPQGLFAGAEEIAGEPSLPARITCMHGETMEVDLNHPLSRYPIDLELRIDALLPESNRRSGPIGDPLHALLQYPGMAAPLLSGEYTDFGDRDEGLSRTDSAADGIFYQIPRLVQHLDSRALETISSLYAEILPAGAEVLDLMGSHDSHLAASSPRSLTVLGMNITELEVNSLADQRLVHDLNTSPATSLRSEAFDAVVCTASIEYLVNPAAVIAEVRRVLRHGGVFAVTFSNRWFPTKAIRIWSELHDFERLGMVTQWLHSAGFTGLKTLSSRGWPRPADDIYAQQIALSDPVFAVSGYKPSD